jgi:hypothetical protein
MRFSSSTWKDTLEKGVCLPFMEAATQYQKKEVWSILVTNDTISMNTKAYARGISHPIACASLERGHP